MLKHNQSLIEERFSYLEKDYTIRIKIFVKNKKKYLTYYFFDLNHEVEINFVEDSDEIWRFGAIKETFGKISSMKIDKNYPEDGKFVLFNGFKLKHSSFLEDTFLIIPDGQRWFIEKGEIYD